jgi:hypothetical protein
MTYAQAAECIKLALDTPYVRGLDMTQAEDRIKLHLYLSGALLVAYWPVYDTQTITERGNA